MSNELTPNTRGSEMDDEQVHEHERERVEREQARHQEWENQRQSDYNEAEHRNVGKLNIKSRDKRLKEETTWYNQIKDREELYTDLQLGIENITRIRDFAVEKDRAMLNHNDEVESSMNDKRYREAVIEQNTNLVKRGSHYETAEGALVPHDDAEKIVRQASHTYDHYVDGLMFNHDAVTQTDAMANEYNERLLNIYLVMEHPELDDIDDPAALKKALDDYRDAEHDDLIGEKQDIDLLTEQMRIAEPEINNLHADACASRVAMLDDKGLNLSNQKMQAMVGEYLDKSNNPGHALDLVSDWREYSVDPLDYRHLDGTTGPRAMHVEEEMLKVNTLSDKNTNNIQAHLDALVNAADNSNVLFDNYDVNRVRTIDPDANKTQLVKKKGTFKLPSEDILRQHGIGYDNLLYNSGPDATMWLDSWPEMMGGKKSTSSYFSHALSNNVCWFEDYLENRYFDQTTTYHKTPESMDRNHGVDLEVIASGEPKHKIDLAFPERDVYEEQQDYVRENNQYMNDKCKEFNDYHHRQFSSKYEEDRFNQLDDAMVDDALRTDLGVDRKSDHNMYNGAKNMRRFTRYYSYDKKDPARQMSQEAYEQSSYWKMSPKERRQLDKDMKQAHKMFKKQQQGKLESVYAQIDEKNRTRFREDIMQINGQKRSPFTFVDRNGQIVSNDAPFIDKLRAAIAEGVHDSMLGYRMRKSWREKAIAKIEMGQTTFQKGTDMIVGGLTAAQVLGQHHRDYRKDQVGYEEAKDALLSGKIDDKGNYSNNAWDKIMKAKGFKRETVRANEADHQMYGVTGEKIQGKFEVEHLQKKALNKKEDDLER